MTQQGESVFLSSLVVARDSFGEVQFQKIDSTEGRLSGLLPRAKDSQTPPLH